MVERSIQQKMDILMKIKSNVHKMKGNIRDVEETNRKVRDDSHHHTYSDAHYHQEGANKPFGNFINNKPSLKYHHYSNNGVDYHNNQLGD
jgi:hypothetical protein